MRHLRLIAILVTAVLPAAAFAAPEVITLGGSTSGDPVEVCGAAASDPMDPGRIGPGLKDNQVFIGGALAACEAALASAPDSAQVQAWLARVYLLAGRRDDARPLLESAVAAQHGYGTYLLSAVMSTGLGNDFAEDPERSFTLLGDAAEWGYPRAAVDLGEFYEFGDGVEADMAEAQRLYQLALDGGDGLGAYKLGYLEESGLAGDGDLARVAAHYEQATTLGEPLGYFGLGRLYEYGSGVTQDYESAAEYYQQGADAGDPSSQTALAYLYEQGLGVEKDFDRSFALLTSAVAKGDSFAEAALSIHYLLGQGTDPDPQRAYSLAWAAQEKGVNYAEGILGYLFQLGIGTERNLLAARIRYEAGANGGDQFSTDQLPALEAQIACMEAAGSQHEPGAFAGVDFAELDADAAIAACENAISLYPGIVGDQVWLARAYLKAGRYDDALPLVDQGVDATNVLALTLKGDMLMEGLGVPSDPAAAADLYQAAAETEFCPAEYALGLAYAAGTGVAADADEAAMWFRRAIGHGINAEADLDKLTGSPSEDEPVDLSGFGREGPGY